MKKNIENAIQNGYNFSISNAIDDGFNIFKKEAGSFIGYALVAGIISVLAAFIPLLNIILAPILMAGFYIVAHKIDNNQPINFNDFFKGFDQFGNILVLILLQRALYMILAMPIIALLFTIGLTNLNENTEELSSLVAGLGTVGVFVSLLTFFAYIFVATCLMASMPLLLFCQYDAFNAMKTSFRLIRRDWFSWFLLALMGGIFYIAGFIVLFIGLIVAIPAVACMNYVAFRDAVKLNESDNIIEEIQNLGTYKPKTESE
jgi:hypothetical protein